MMTYLESERLLLRALEPEDLPLLYAWENDSTLWHTGSTLAPFSRYALKQYISNAVHQDIYSMKQVRLMICLKEGRGEAIGTLDLFNFDAHSGKAEVGILIDKSYQGKGYGREALVLLLGYAFCYLHLHQLYAYVCAENEASLSIYKGVGFQTAGILKDWMRGETGAHCDAQILQLLLKDYLKKS